MAAVVALQVVQVVGLVVAVVQVASMLIQPPKVAMAL